jgi:hypothetical protein
MFVVLLNVPPAPASRLTTFFPIERLVVAHINTIILETLDPLQFANLPNRSTDYAISIALHTALSHLDTKLRILGLNTSICNWILDFLMGCPKVVRVGNNTSTTLTLNTGASQGHDCVSTHDSNTYHH